MLRYIDNAYVIDKANTFKDIENYLRKNNQFENLAKVRGIFNEFLASVGALSSKYKVAYIDGLTIQK